MLPFHWKWKSLCDLDFRALLSKMFPVVRNKITECSYFRRVSKDETPSHPHQNSSVHKVPPSQEKNTKIEKYLQVIRILSGRCDRIPLNEKMGENI